MTSVGATRSRSLILPTVRAWAAHSTDGPHDLHHRLAARDRAGACRGSGRRPSTRRERTRAAPYAADSRHGLGAGAARGDHRTRGGTRLGPDGVPARAGLLPGAAAGVVAELDTERKVAAERQSLLEQADERLRAAFATVSAEALRSNSRTFLNLAKASLGEFQKQAASDLERRQQTIDDLVKPLHESLAKVDAKLHQVEKERVGSASQLTEQVAHARRHDHEPRTCAAHAERAWRVGRGTAASSGGDGRHARPLPFRREAGGHIR